MRIKLCLAISALLLLSGCSLVELKYLINPDSVKIKMEPRGEVVGVGAERHHLRVGEELRLVLSNFDRPEDLWMVWSFGWNEFVDYEFDDKSKILVIKAKKKTLDSGPIELLFRNDKIGLLSAKVLFLVVS